MADPRQEITKKQIRTDIIARRDALSDIQKKAASDEVCAKVLADPFYVKAHKILGFMPFGSEIDIKPILEQALKDEKEVYLPRITTNGFHKEMEFRKVTDVNPVNFSFGKYKILEPSEENELYEYNEADAMMLPYKDIMIMPGVAFDTYNKRVGYGGGYFDRFLEDKLTLRLHSIGVCHKCQMVEYEIPEDEGDVRPFKIYFA